MFCLTQLSERGRPSSRLASPRRPWISGGRLLLCLLASARWVIAAVELPPHPRAATSWAAAKVDAAARTSITDSAAIVLDPKHDHTLPAESFSIQAEAGRIVLRAADPNGELYGLLELAERLSNRPPGPWQAFVSGFTPIEQSPFIGFRADNPFIQMDRSQFAGFAQRHHLMKTPPLFGDLEMWKQYIDQLAENRFNTLDLHGIYNLSTTGFYNLLPALVSVPEYPDIGDPKVQKRNLSNLRHLVSHCNKRGIALGLMNYSTRVEGIKDAALRDYTEKAVCALLKALPKLHLTGFRVGESGQTADFFADAYLKGLEKSGRSDVTIYTRSWKTTPKELDAMAGRLDGKLDVEIKYNGEQLGLPYQALLGPANSHYSYGDFLEPGRRYGCIWQVRANGTHRFWTWENTEFIRRAVKTFSFGGARGFSLEPEMAYFPWTAATYYRSAEDQKSYQYIWQKYWPWYLAWGRLSYNPELPEETLVNAFRARFGDAGKDVYDAMQSSGTIVPLAMAYRFTGPDQRNMSPETQTSAFDPVRHEAITPLTFAHNTPMDPRSFVGIDEYVTQRIKGKSDGRIGPREVSGIFKTNAERTQKLISAIDLNLPNQGQWRLLRTDLLCASWLGKYYAARIEGAMSLDAVLQVGTGSDIDGADAALMESRHAWAQLSDTADAVFAPLQNPLIGQTNFVWRSEYKRLAKLDATIPDLWDHRPSNKGSLPQGMAKIDLNAGARFDGTVSAMDAKRRTDGAVELSCEIQPPEPAAAVTLWFKDLPSETPWTSLPMKAQEGIYTAIAPLPAGGLLCLVEVRLPDGRAAQFPSALKQTPYWVVPDSVSPAPSPQTN